jgi:hypothetical protein
MARTPFSPPEAHIVVSTDGYFDVYPSPERSDGDKPAYRGQLAELGAGIRGADDRLAVRPGSMALADAVSAWSAAHGADAVGGRLGRGRGPRPHRHRLTALGAALDGWPTLAAPCWLAQDGAWASA